MSFSWGGPLPAKPLPATTLLLDNVVALIDHLDAEKRSAATVVRITDVEHLLATGRIGGPE